MPRLITAILLVLALPHLAMANSVDAVFAGAEKIGESTFRALGRPIYNARLYTQNGRAFDWNQDFALLINYQRNISQKDIVETTLREMKRMGSRPPIDNQLRNCFSAVGKGDQYLAVTDGPNQVSFWRNFKPVCTLINPQIKRRFMSIFLGENSRSAKFTKELRGE
ncbi:hypothetical protein GCM10008927_06500 [Amylibacter ulvae]|uniref:Chalcone isomerase domain-containing protein n=1 Tax=Paramylibacter ulvae TaxID=1651968 RepID=A0ABQ3CWV2_9RHOB|nr:hypothetical protein [Amylibacter ulvae]GHA44386.1 hypothetical protein GCM10008927_06500 [Amylibacter ulvae]